MMEWPQTVSVLGTLLGLVYLLIRQFDKRFAELRSDVDKRFEQVDKRIDDLRADMDTRFAQVERRFDQADQRFDRIERLLERLLKPELGKA